MPVAYHQGRLHTCMWVRSLSGFQPAQPEQAWKITDGEAAGVANDETVRQEKI